MNYTDKKQLEAIYEAQLIFNRINAESHLLEEGFFNSITSGLNWGEWLNKALPYIGTIGLSMVGVNLISKVLEFLGKKADTVSEKDAQAMYKYAPPEIQKRFDELAQLKEKDPEAYQAGVKQIRDYAMRDFKDKLEAKGVKVEGSLLGKTLSKIGSFGNSFLGTIIITGGIFAIMHFLGIYSPPPFINKTLGDRAGEYINASKDRAGEYINASKAGYETLAGDSASDRVVASLKNPVDTITGAVATIGDIAATNARAAAYDQAGRETLKKLFVKYADNPEMLAKLKKAEALNYK
jgi:hypothetical protein